MRGDVPLVAAVDLAAVEDGGGVAEYEVDVAFDVAIAIVLPAPRGVDRVLPADEAAAAESGAVEWTESATACEPTPKVFSKVMLRASKPSAFTSTT